MLDRPATSNADRSIDEPAAGVEFAIRYSLRDYRRVVVDEIVRKVRADRSGRISRRRQVSALAIVSVAVVTSAIGRTTAIGADAVAVALMVASVVAVVWLVASTTRGLALIGSLIACIYATAVGKLKPVYHFTVSPAGIRRRSPSSDVLVVWSRVLAVHRLSSAWLVELGEGAMPILHRVLTPAMRARLEILIAEHGPAAGIDAGPPPVEP